VFRRHLDMHREGLASARGAAALRPGASGGVSAGGGNGEADVHDHRYAIMFNHALPALPHHRSPSPGRERALGQPISPWACCAALVPSGREPLVCTLCGVHRGGA